MLLGFAGLSYALYQDKNRKINWTSELYDENKKEVPTSYLITSAIILLIVELFFLYFAITIALQVSKNRGELLMNLGLAVFLTLPYVLLHSVARSYKLK
jgi:positive regulator of sigma E activity